MNLLHGTSSANSVAIVSEGLKPRYDRRGTWFEEYHQPSLPEFVYLTPGKFHADFYAFRAALIDDSDCSVITTECDEQQLYPDENIFVSGFISKSGLAAEQRKVKDNKHLWAESLKKKSLVCHHGPISPDQLKSVNTYKKEDSIHYSLIKNFDNKSISSFNHIFCCWDRAGCTNWALEYRENHRYDEVLSAVECYLQDGIVHFALDDEITRIQLTTSPF